MDHTPRLCLNMIIRNESAIISRCLESVVGHVDCYVIVDTGSSDTTMDIIRSWAAKHGIEGELHQCEWSDFSTCRNAALDFARASPLPWDYLLLMDADLQWVVDDPNWRTGLTGEAQSVQHHMPDHNINWAPRLLHRSSDRRYRGRTHERLFDLGPPPIAGVYIRDWFDGSSHDVKAARDLPLLELDLADNDKDAHCWYYYAQTLRVTGRYRDAVVAFDRYLAIAPPGYPRFEAIYWRARSLLHLGNVEGFVIGLADAHNLGKDRPEAMLAAADYFYQTGDYVEALRAAEAGVSCRQNALYGMTNASAWVAEYYWRAAIHSDDPATRKRGVAMCRRLASELGVADVQRNNARRQLRIEAQDRQTRAKAKQPKRSTWVTLSRNQQRTIISQ